jgi:hypothetical protein
MVIISFPNGRDWYKANWVFRKLQKDIGESYPKDRELNREMEKASAFGALALASIEHKFGRHIVAAMKTVAAATVQGKLPGWAGEKPNDEDGQRMYLEAMTELLEIIEQQPSAK